MSGADGHMAGGDKAPGAGGRPGFGVGCDKAVRTDPHSDIHTYPKDGGPVVLRAGETDRPQLYCTDSVTVSGKILATVPVDTPVVIGSGCVVEANPVII
ncbi:hypothetical protein OG301_38175 [Streptomyces platensis]|uniref:hypothetical protein n=1 Tax=Streptomyces platensis TaxID=58346 RepID=UPI002E8240A3|nr:hypothetical protein [Streptomyces platensis]WTI56696.1 hypothetical protein OG301_38175 [Streptomyces platensis]WUB77807.1 hypothetical protein OG424_00520 [Streptomyces platensis]